MESTAVTYQNRRLCYTGQKCRRIPDGLANLYGTKTHSLDLSYNEIGSLKGLEGFCFLRELILDNNQLSDSLVLPYLPYLHTLSLNKNQVNIIEELIGKVIDNLPALTFLSLLGNKACPNQLSDLDNDDDDYQRYRYFVLYHVPNLIFLDSSKVSEAERSEAKRRGKFMKIVRPDRTGGGDTGDEPENPAWHAAYTPLSRSVRHPSDHRGSYAKCRYKYSGKHSEGNRFISNNDL